MTLIENAPSGTPIVAPGLPTPFGHPAETQEDLVGVNPPSAAPPMAADGAGTGRTACATMAPPRRPPLRTRYLPYRYEVPGVATIGSEVQLPELQWFLTPFLTRSPFDIEIRVARVGRPRGSVRFTAHGDVERLYEEHLGGLGANFRIEMGDTIHVTAGPLLEHSPHVLYTNVIEMLLRFLAVARGRVLLHSACVQLDGRGVMLSARTDTGKTGTILRLIREQGAVFLSDDMTIVGPDGKAHCFPKPLTISHHTLRAVDTKGLSRTDWRKLRLQSRLHSKEGRSFGMRLAQMNLPIMTLNAVVQAIVPPPKYDVDRLVPCDVIHEVSVSDLFIIERGPNGVEDVSRERSLRELIENTDDAYGFPPFAILAPTLQLAGMDYGALRAREEQLLDELLVHLRVRRVVRDDFGWPAQIRAIMEDAANPSDVAQLVVDESRTRPRRPDGLAAQTLHAGGGPA